MEAKMQTEFHEEKGRIETENGAIPFAWVGATDGRVFFVTPGGLLVQSIPEERVLAIVSEERRAA
jgi:hypothetical protein